MNHLNTLSVDIGAMSNTRIIISCVDYNHEILSVSDFQEHVVTQLINFYHVRLCQNLAAMRALKEMGIPESIVTQHKLGLCDRTLHQQLVSNKRVYEQLLASGLTETAISKGKFGYCDRTLNRNIKRSVTTDGAAFRGCMRRLGLIKATGHELLRGCVVEPMFNDKGDVISACGVKLSKRVRRNAPSAIYWYRQDVYTELMPFTLSALGGLYVD